MREAERPAPAMTVGTRTLTFLFADLRDYTAYVERYGDAAGAALLAEYRQLVRSEVARSGGGEVKTEGDSFYVVFASARQALQCATAILAGADERSRRQPTAPIRVGIGLHVGEPVPQGDQYVGSAVNVAARLASAAGAGELLVTDLVRALAQLPPEVSSEERQVSLKGVAVPPRVHVLHWRTLAPRAAARPPATPRAQPAREVSISAEAPRDRRVLCPEVVGREDELARLRSFLAEAEGGAGRTVLIGGDAGLGKTALLERFAADARAAGARVHRGECDEIDARRAFGPFLALLRGAMREFGAGAADEPLRGKISDLLGVFTDGGELGAELSESDRFRAYATFARRFGDIAAAGTVVLCVEDLHWADQASLELLPYLARRLEDHRILLVGTYRTDELHRLHPLRHVLAELARARLVEEVRLRPLDRAQLALAIRGALGLARDPTPEFLAALEASSEGNPLFLEEILRSLIDKGDLSYRDGAWRRTKDVAELTIPETLRDAVRERAARLDEGTRSALRYAAIIGRRFDFDLLAAVSGLSESDLVRSLRAAVDAQLVIEEVGKDGDERYLFRHALTRESILAELLQRERRLMHRAVGEAIERRSPDPAPLAEELAYHFDQARDSARARRYHDLAARESTRAFAFSKAVEHLERAIELAPDGDPELAPMQRRLSDAAYHAGDAPRALRAAQQAHRIFSATNDPRHAAEALARVAHFQWLLGDSERADTAAREAAATIEPLGPSPELARALAMVAKLHMLHARDAEAIEWGDRALAMAREIGDRSVEADALASVGLARHRSGDTERALEDLREALRIARADDLSEPAERTYYNLWVVLYDSGRATEARATHEESVRWAEAARHVADPLLHRTAWYAFADGDWRRLRSALGEPSGQTIFSAQVGLLGALAVALTEGPAASLAAAEGSRAQLRGASGNHRYVAISVVAQILLVNDDHAAVLETLRPLRVSSGLQRVLSGGAATALWSATILGDRGERNEWLERLRAVRADRPLVVPMADAEAAALEEDHARAARAYAAAADAMVAAELLPFPALLLRLRAIDELLAAADPDRVRAASLLREARAFWERAGATWLLGWLDRWAKEREIPATPA